MRYPRTYWDAGSSEPLHPAARDTLLAAFDSGYADPRRLHHPARSARLLLDNAREATAEALGVRPDEVTFTSSGTDAVHRGLLGLLPRGQANGQAGAVAASAVEHSAVWHALRWAGPRVHTLPVSRTGVVDLEAVSSDAAGSRVVAVQHANHETGTVQPLAEVSQVFASSALFVDACASAGRIPLPEQWSTAAASAHKWGGPPGVGVLLVRKSARWRNPFPDDDRVDPRTSGFENIPAILAAAAALQAVTAEAAEVGRRHFSLIDRLRSRLQALPDVEVVGEPERRLPHVLTFSCLYLNGEALVTELDRAGFCVASGSACSSSALTPSHVLEAMGVLTHGNVRVSLGRDADAESVDRFMVVLTDVIATLRAQVGL